MAKKPKPNPAPFGSHRYLDECFGHCSLEKIKKCPCPSSCKQLCLHTLLDPWNGPRVEGTEAGEGKVRHYTPILNAIARSWGPKLPEPSPAVKLTYIGLVTYTRPGRRWITQHTDRLAADLGMSRSQFSKCCQVLEETYGLIRRVPARELSHTIKSNRKVILLLDFPEDFPGHLRDEEWKAKERWRSDDEDEEPDPRDDLFPEDHLLDYRDLLPEEDE